MELSQVTKGGEMLLQTQVVRNKLGISITIRTSPTIEDMMATMSLETKPRNILEYGRYWKSEKDLLVYGLPADLAGTKNVSGRLSYRLDRPGNALDLNEGRLGGDIVNLSFLRLVGVSEGTTFTVNTVYSRDGVAELCKRIEEATRHFYIQYLKPVDMRIMVMTQELS